MTAYEAIMNRRTIRKFKQEPLDNADLIRLVDCARMAAYGANAQPLKFRIITEKETLDKIFPKTKWAAMLADGAPAENERPTAYIAVIGDTKIKKNFEVDAGAAVTTMMIAAEEMGIATCWLGAIDRDGIKTALKLGDEYELPYMLALGKPAQKSCAVAMNDESTKYFMSEDGILNVPKRSLEDVMI